MEGLVVRDINVDNVSKYPIKCFISTENIGYIKKLDWFKKRLAEGMKIKLLFTKEDEKYIGYIEYIPGEFAWRAVEAGGYLFIHCIWITPKKNHNKGYASFLINEAWNDAKKQDKYGLVVISSEGPFMAGKNIFLKNGFESVASSRPSYELLIKKLKEGPRPKINNWEQKLDEYNGWNIVYSNQCPWIARFIDEVDNLLKKRGLNMTITELKTAKEAQNAPSVYASFNLIHNGRLLADHYISSTRFLNIIDEELKQKN